MSHEIALSRAHKVFAVEETTRGTLVFPAPALQAKGTITLGGLPTADTDTLTIGTQTFTFKATRSGLGEITVGLSASACVTNIVAAITADLPSLVTAEDGAGDTVVVTAVDPGLAGNSIVFTESATNITIDGSGMLGATQAGTDGCMIAPANQWIINQNPGFTDSPEIVDSLDVIDRFQDAFPAGTWSGQMIARPSGVAGVPPQGDVLFESLQGGRAVNAGVSVVYAQSKEKTSFTLWVQQDHTVFFLTGCTVASMKPTVSNKGPLVLDCSGQGMKMGWAGTSALSGTEAAGQTVLSVDNAKLFCVGARIWNSTKNDDNGGLGYAITEVDVTGNTITVGTALPTGGWANDDVIEGFLPVGIIIGEAIECRNTAISINSVATAIKTMDLTIESPVVYQDDEITTSGYPEDYVENARNISGTVNFKFRKTVLAYFYDAILGLDIPFDLVFGSGAGHRMRIYMPKVNLEVPTKSDSAPVIDIAMGLKALGTAGEDSCEIKFY